MKTLMPIPWFQPLDEDGNIIPGGKVRFYAAGTATLATIYQDGNGGATHTNPLILDGSGMAAVFLDARAYKITLSDASDVFLREIDIVSAVPLVHPDVDIPATAGESLGARKAVYQSQSDGFWYLANATLAQTSTQPVMMGFTVDAIAIGVTGTVRVIGQMNGFTGLVIGSRYYVSTTSGGITTTAPTFARTLGAAHNATTMNIYPGAPSTGHTVITGDQSVVLPAGSTHNQALDAAVSRLFVTSGAGGSTLTGLTGGADGRELRIFNYGSAETLTFAAESASSLAANRFGNASTLAGGAVGIYHYTPANRWWRIN